MDNRRGGCKTYRATNQKIYCVCIIAGTREIVKCEIGLLCKKLIPVEKQAHECLLFVLRFAAFNVNTIAIF